MNIIFMGTPEFAVPSLNILLNTNHNISAVVTAPDKPKGRGLKVAYSDIKKFALEQNNGINILQPDKLSDKNFVNEIKSLDPDLIIVVAFRILPKEIYRIPKYGSINLHASILPKFRGAAPINWAIITGEKETGVTTFFLEDKVDTGNIIQQNYIDISPEDDAGILHDKLKELGALTVYSTVNMIERSGGRPTVSKQNDFDASPAPKIFKKDCLIDWEQQSDDVYNFIRGLAPFPGAYTIHEGKSIKIFRTEKIHKDSLKGPGRLLIFDDKLCASCLDEFLEVKELQLEGKKRMNAADFLAGHYGIFKKIYSS
ncbi:MAG: methionyl-tRNA formyltransferase [Ignavibacteria bacterium]|nr:methionyl-tRNA formyltransferase [Ignavibacteria bacterium]